MGLTSSLLQKHKHQGVQSEQRRTHNPTNSGQLCTVLSRLTVVSRS